MATNGSSSTARPNGSAANQSENHSSHGSPSPSESASEEESGSDDHGEGRLNGKHVTFDGAPSRSNGPSTNKSSSSSMSSTMDKKSMNSIPDGQQSLAPKKSPLEETGWHMRHGWDTQYTEEALLLLTTTFYMYFNDKRHETGGHGKSISKFGQLQDWRMRDRLKTVSAALAICLNLGVDPPDIIKTHPSAKLECWVDPSEGARVPNNKVMDTIGKALCSQYEQLSLRTRYKALQDPTSDELKRCCVQLRKNAKEERLLFHYNGHGVPKPTGNGEIWAFNKGYTQYIPISLTELTDWLGAPALYVYDTSAAGRIIAKFVEFAEQRDKDLAEARHQDASIPLVSFGDCIHLGACLAEQELPTNPALPADLFTACLTTPIHMAIRFFIMRNPLPTSLVPDDSAKIPGSTADRKTPMGELTWIFTAVTDTIAWNSLPKPLFKKLFRQDLMVAALFRNFLLAQRIMRVYLVNPISHPEIPSTHDHPLWASWDYAVEMVLSQLPLLLKAQAGETTYEYQGLDFFAEQLTAFEVYLDHGAKEQKEPEQLPIVLQVLLSQVHRTRALRLLAQFLDLGSWAVHLCLGIGIFPYVLKLLQSTSPDLRPQLVFIWARIIAVDQTCQGDLVKENGYQYFVNTLNPSTGMPVNNVSEHRAMSAFIIAMFCKDFRQGQQVANSPDLIHICLGQILEPETDNPFLRQWACLCLSQLWKGYDEAKRLILQPRNYTRLCNVAWDPVPEVRCAMLNALTTLIGNYDQSDEEPVTERIVAAESRIATRVLPLARDASSLVRREYSIFLSAFVSKHPMKIMHAAVQTFKRSHSRPGSSHSEASDPRVNGIDGDALADDIFFSIWKQCLILATDPDLDVAQNASAIVRWVLDALAESRRFEHTDVAEALESVHNVDEGTRFMAGSSIADDQPPPSPSKTISRSTSSYFGSFRRTTSVAASLKQLAFGGSEPAPEPPHRAASVKSFGNIRPGGLPAIRSQAELSRMVDDMQSHDTKRYARYPTSRGFEPLRPGSVVSLPLQSSFLDWLTEYYQEPQMQQAEADEPGSNIYNERLFKRNRNERILDETQRLKDHAGSSKWVEQAGFFDNEFQAVKMCFHQYESHLIVADSRNTIRVWDWDKRKPISLMNKFLNGNPLGTEITGLRFVNEDDQALLMTGSCDGVIRIFRNYENSEEIDVPVAFRAMPEVETGHSGPGFVFDWIQTRGLILTAGESPIIRIFDAATETCLRDIRARSNSWCAALTSDQVQGNTFVAGHGDGVVQAYDQRLRPGETMPRWREHKRPIVSVHLQRGGQRELVSGSTDGQVKLWDLRMLKSIRTISATTDTLKSFCVHEHAPVCAIGTQRRNVRVHNLDGAFLSSFEPHSSLSLQRRSTPISATAFHPHRMLLACAAQQDSHVTLISCGELKEEPQPLALEIAQAIEAHTAPPPLLNPGMMLL